MKKQLKRAGLLAGLGATLALVGGAAMPANATELTPVEDPEVMSSTQGMNVTGYDEAVANAHGYEIVTHADGSQESVPVTPEAIAEQAAIDDMVTTFDEAYGNCGRSWVYSTKIANDTVAIQTGFSVGGPTVSRNWRVHANTFFTSNTLVFPNGPTASGYWSAEGALPGLVGPGVAGVPTTATAVKTNGSVCTSAGPTSTFG